MKDNEAEVTRSLTVLTQQGKDARSYIVLQGLQLDRHKRVLQPSQSCLICSFVDTLSYAHACQQAIATMHVTPSLVYVSRQLQNLVVVWPHFQLPC